MSHEETLLEPVLQPIPSTEPMPSRKVIRSWMAHLMQRSTARALTLLVVDYVIFFALIAAAIGLDNGWLRLLAGLTAGFWIGRLFILGHDACHQSYTDNRNLNRILGRIAFLPSMSAYSMWEVGHNVMHHGFTNLKGMDFVWLPKTKEEYDALSSFGKLRERVYRSGWGTWLYYTIEIWWTKMYFPNAQNKPGERKAFFWDNVLVSVFAVIWLGLIYAFVPANVGFFPALITAFVIPFLFWNGMIGWVVYINHTHKDIAWYDNKKEWTAAQPFVTTTVHLTFKRKFGAAMHHIMEHTAHHLDMTIPLYKLKEAQEHLERMLPNRIVIQPFSWKWYFANAKMCKLYDYKAHQWIGFNGQPTTQPVIVNP
ncbi:MAG: fatty acid desaturase [Formosimonas sp.]